MTYYDENEAAYRPSVQTRLLGPPDDGSDYEVDDDASWGYHSDTESEYASAQENLSDPEDGDITSDSDSEGDYESVREDMSDSEGDNDSVMED